MNLAGIPGTKRTHIGKLKLRNLKQTIRKKNIKNSYRGTNDFKQGYQPRTNIVKDEKGNLVRLPQYFG